MGHSKPILPEQSSGPLSGLRSGGDGDLKAAHLANILRLKARRMADPSEIYAQFPDRWQRYLHDNYASYLDVARKFSVSEKAAKKWWDRLGGPNGGKVAYAVRTDPNAAQFLFAAE